MIGQSKRLPDRRGVVEGHRHAHQRGEQAGVQATRRRHRPLHEQQTFVFRVSIGNRESSTLFLANNSLYRRN